ncbi:MAG: hypothetical protein AAF810_05420 [Cyanobacteria bacterium P01_D01_bin.36]
MSLQDFDAANQQRIQQAIADNSAAAQARFYNWRDWMNPEFIKPVPFTPVLSHAKRGNEDLWLLSSWSGDRFGWDKDDDTEIKLWHGLPSISEGSPWVDEWPEPTPKSGHAIFLLNAFVTERLLLLGCFTESSQAVTFYGGNQVAIPRENILAYLMVPNEPPKLDVWPFSSSGRLSSG